MRYIFLLCWLLGSLCSFSQSGNYFLSHHSPQKERSDNVCFSIAQNDRGLMYFATRSGVLEFDGRNWNLIPGHGAIYSLQVSKDVVYWAGAFGFGKIGYNSNGLPELSLLSDSVRDVFQTLVIKDKAFFLNNEALFLAPSNQAKPIVIRSNAQTGAFTGMFELFQTIYITCQTGLFKVINQKLIPTSLGFSAEDHIVFSTGLRNQYLIGMSDNRIFLCGENLKPREIKLADQAYLNSSVVVNGTWLNSDLIALGTLRGGMVFVNTLSGKTQEIVNYSTGLPDNEVFALAPDKNLGVWAAHEYGFTRIAPYLPFRSFSHYNGLQGNLLCAISFQEDVYVGTSLGLYKLEKEDIYEEIIYYEDVKIPVPKKEPLLLQQQPIEQVKQDVPLTPVQKEAEVKKRGLKGLFKRGKVKPTPPSDIEKSKEVSTVLPKTDENIKPQIEPAITSNYKRVKRSDRVLRKSQFTYKKVKGVNAKVTQLLEVDGELIASGLGGTFTISDLQASVVVDEPTRYVLATNENLLVVSTYSDEVKILKHESKGWRDLKILKDLRAQISYMFNGNPNELWLCSIDKIYQININNPATPIIAAIGIVNPNYEDVVGVYVSNAVYITNTQGFKVFNRDSASFQSIDSLSSSSILNYFAHKNNIWYRNAHTWSLFGSSAGQRNLLMLNLFQNLRFISSDENSENLWVITGSNELYKFYGERFTPYEVGFSVLLKSIQNGEGQRGNLKNLKFEEDKSSLIFQVIQPDYLAAQAIEYRYQLENLENEWVEWSSQNNTISFPYLPAGDYSLKVQAKDIFGKIKDMPTIRFEVLPPYWKRPWFYALEFIVFAVLVLISFRMSTRYRIISRLLSLLTIIMLIQLIQTIIGERFETGSSPVIDFFIQVIVAFLILPVEGYLRNLMLRSIDSPNRLHRILSMKPSGNIKDQHVP